LRARHIFPPLVERDPVGRGWQVGRSLVTWDFRRSGCNERLALYFFQERVPASTPAYSGAPEVGTTTLPQFDRLRRTGTQNYMNLAEFAERHTGFYKAQLSLRLAFDLARKAKRLRKPDRPVKPKPMGNEKKNARAKADYDSKLQHHRRKLADNEHAEAVFQEIVKAARQRPINEVEATKIKRQMDYKRADRSKQPRGRPRARR
jgi:hypothetical protein